MKLAVSASHTIEVLPDGSLRKDHSDEGLTERARLIRSDALHDPTREPAAYRLLLGPRGIGPRCFDAGENWVVLERLDAVPLWQCGEPSAWIAAARRIGEIHAELRDAATGVGEVPLLDHVAVAWSHWHRRAVACRLPAAVLDGHRRACSVLAGASPTVVHGDLYASNVLIGGRDTDGPALVAPIDWELVGTGPGELDLAAVTSGGGLAPDLVVAMENAYEVAAGRLDRDVLAAARIHVCVQWSSMPPGWNPPRSQRHRWLDEAVRRVEHWAAAP